MKLNIFMQSNLFHQINMDIYECRMCINNTLFSGCFVLSARLSVCVCDFFFVCSRMCVIQNFVYAFELLVWSMNLTYWSSCACKCSSQNQKCETIGLQVIDSMENA